MLENSLNFDSPLKSPQLNESKDKNVLKEDFRSKEFNDLDNKSPSSIRQDENKNFL